MTVKFIEENKITSQVLAGMADGTVVGPFNVNYMVTPSRARGTRNSGYPDYQLAIRASNGRFEISVGRNLTINRSTKTSPGEFVSDWMSLTQPMALWKLLEELKGNNYAAVGEIKNLGE